MLDMVFCGILPRLLCFWGLQNRASDLIPQYWCLLSAGVIFGKTCFCFPLLDMLFPVVAAMAAPVLSVAKQAMHSPNP